jgi:hypothetical protein
MKTFRIGIAGAAAIACIACAGHARTSKAGSSGAARAETGQESSPAAAAPTAGAPATQAPGPTEVQGRVERIDRANNVTLAGSERVGHAFEQLKLDDGTRITVDGKEATPAEVHEGDEVRASFSVAGDELHVDRLDVLTSAH